MQFLPFVLEATPGPNNERQKRALSDDDCGGRAELMLRFLPPNKVCWQTFRSRAPLASPCSCWPALSRSGCRVCRRQDQHAVSLILVLCVGWLAGWLACWLQMLNEMQLGKLRKAAKLAAMLADPDALDTVDKEDAGASSVRLST